MQPLTLALHIFPQIEERNVFICDTIFDFEYNRFSKNFIPRSSVGLFANLIPILIKDEDGKSELDILFHELSELLMMHAIYSDRPGTT